MPNGAGGPPTADFWLPFLAQQGSSATDAQYDRPGPGDLHYDPEYWFVARYSHGARCSGIDDVACCGAVDDGTEVRYAIARYDSSTGAPREIDCLNNLVTWTPDPAPSITEEDPAVGECNRMSAAWHSSLNNTDLFGAINDRHGGPDA